MAKCFADQNNTYVIVGDRLKLNSSNSENLKITIKKSSKTADFTRPAEYKLTGCYAYLSLNGVVAGWEKIPAVDGFTDVLDISFYNSKDSTKFFKTIIREPETATPSKEWSLENGDFKSLAETDTSRTACITAVFTLKRTKKLPSPAFKSGSSITGIFKKELKSFSIVFPK